MQEQHEMSSWTSCSELENENIIVAKVATEEKFIVCKFMIKFKILFFLVAEEEEGLSVEWIMYRFLYHIIINSKSHVRWCVTRWHTKNERWMDAKKRTLENVRKLRIIKIEIISMTLVLSMIHMESSSSFNTQRIYTKNSFILTFI